MCILILKKGQCMVTKKQDPLRKCYQGEGENAITIDCATGMDTCLRFTTLDGKTFTQCSFGALNGDTKDDCSLLANEAIQFKKTCFCNQDFCNKPVIDTTTSSKPTDLGTNSTEGSGETSTITAITTPNSSQSTFQVETEF